jgi:2,4-dienoyl-CoA reductase-like NADH-dependent reductase (Old Yellow Enzyme family)
VKGGDTVAEAQAPVTAQELNKIFRGPVIAAGGFNPDTAETNVANGDASLIAFGRHFIANPDRQNGSSSAVRSIRTIAAPAMASIHGLSVREQFVRRVCKRDHAD